MSARRSRGPPASPRASQIGTPVGSISSRSKNRAMRCWGCPGSSRIAAQTSGDAARSSPGRTTVPVGSRATASISPDNAGKPPVSPAAITGSVGGLAFHRSACATSKRLRRSAGSRAPCSPSIPGQCSVTMRRNSRMSCQCLAKSCGTTAASCSKPAPSVCASSRKRASARASMVAWPGGMWGSQI